MGYKLCMAEKPSAARDIASVIGADKKCKGYYEGNGYRDPSNSKITCLS